MTDLLRGYGSCVETARLLARSATLCSDTMSGPIHQHSCAKTDMQHLLHLFTTFATKSCRWLNITMSLHISQHPLGVCPAPHCLALMQADQQPQTSTSAAAAAEAAAAAASRQAAYEAATGQDASPIQLRLAQELFDKGFSDFR